MGNSCADAVTNALVARLTRRRAFLLAPVAAVALGHSPVPRSAARQAGAAPELLVRGEAAFAANSGPLAWRVVRDVAEVGAAAGFEQRALGFAVASGPFGSFLLTDEATGSAYRLNPGEAAFVRGGTFQRRESLGRGPDSYLRIGLVEAAAARDAGGDWMIFPGPAFAAPAGPVTLTLSRVTITPGESRGLTPDAGETLLLVEQGEVELEIGEAAPRDLLRTVVGSDTSYAVRSVGASAMLYGAREGTTLLVATIDVNQA